MPGRSGLTVQFDFIHSDPGTTFPAFRSQYNILAEAGYYFGGPRLRPFFRNEQQTFPEEQDRGEDRRNDQFGLTWYPLGHTLTARAVWTILQHPNDPATPTANQSTIRLQFFYL
jgi:hypothetical protein